MEYDDANYASGVVDQVDDLRGQYVFRFLCVEREAVKER